MADPKTYDGPKRRTCDLHCTLEETVKRSVPRWVFVGSMTSMLILAVSFAGWHLTSLSALKLELFTRMAVNEGHIGNRLADANQRYGEDVERFIRAVSDNRKLLKNLAGDVTMVQIAQAKITAKQDLVLEKINLTQ